MSWIHEVVSAYCENEAPPKFFYWAAVSAISAVMRKNVFLDRHHYKLYPNVYVFLVARSGMKKSIPIAAAKTLTSKANACRIISGRNSMPRILKDLGTATTLEGGGMIKDAQGFLISGELAAFLVEDKQALTILTDLYDTHANEEKWENKLKVSGVDTLKSPCLTLLGATNEEHFVDAVPPNAIGGGFIARTFIVHSDDRVILNSLMRAPKVKPNLEDLSAYLKEIAQVKGEMKCSDQAMDAYDTWYYDFYKDHRDDPTGTFGRLGDQVLKLSMILSLAESPGLKIEDNHIKIAIDNTIECLPGMQMVTMGSGESQFARQTKMVIRALLAAPDHQIQKNRLLQKYWGEFDSFDLDRIAESLQQQNAIHVIQQGRTCTYVMLEEAVKLFTEFFNIEKKKIQ